MAHRVFVSYSTDDGEQAEAVYAGLKKCGIGCWMAPYDIAPGTEFAEAINSAIERAEMVVLIFSSNANDSTYVLREITLAANYHVPVIPFRIEEIEPAKGLAFFICSHQWFEATTSPLDTHIEALAKAIGNPKVEDVAVGSKPVITTGVPEGFRPVRVFESLLIESGSFSVEPENTVWVSDRKEIAIFGIDSPDAKELWHLPDVRWKTYLSKPWQDGLVLSDWDGNLNISTRHAQREMGTLRNARYQDLPLHLLASDSEGRLAAASWDGRVLLWDGNSRLLFAAEPGSVPYLPTHILPLSGDQVAVVDEKRNLRLFNRDGREEWSHKIGGDVSHAWSGEVEQGRQGLFLVVDRNRIVRVNVSDRKEQEITMKAGVHCLSHRISGGARETLLMLDNWGCEWLSWSPFLIVTPKNIPRDFSGRDAVAICDRRRKTVRMGIGLDTDGNLFAIEGSKIHKYPLPPATGLAVGPDQRFLYLADGERMYVYRNPLIEPIRCEVDLIDVEGSLKVDQYQEIAVNLRNSGDVPISSVASQLSGKDDCIRPVDGKKVSGLLYPGQEIRLIYSVMSLAKGKVPLTLRLDMKDEAGPPVWSSTIDLSVDSE